MIWRSPMLYKTFSSPMPKMCLTNKFIIDFTLALVAVAFEGLPFPMRRKCTNMMVFVVIICGTVCDV